MIFRDVPDIFLIVQQLATANNKDVVPEPTPVLQGMRAHAMAPADGGSEIQTLQSQVSVIDAPTQRQLSASSAQQGTTQVW